MDSNKMLIGFVIAVVGFLAFPVVMNKMKTQGGAPAAPAAASPQAAAPGAAPPPPQGQPANEPPLLNEQNLVGSNWQFFFQNYKIKLTFAPGGVAYATHPMAKALTGMDYIEGRWRLQYDKLFLNASAGGNEINEEFQISGNKIFQMRNGKRSGELERF